MSESKDAEQHASASPKRTLVSLSRANEVLPFGGNTAKRIEATDPTFPRLIRLSARKVLLDVDATVAWAREQAGKAPRSIRGDAERAAVAPAAKPRNVRRGGA